MPSRSHVGKGSEKPLRRRKGISVTRQGNEVLLELKNKHHSREEGTKDRDSNRVQNRVCCTSRWSAEGSQSVSLGSCFPTLCRVKQRMDKYEYCMRTKREFSKSKRKWLGLEMDETRMGNILSESIRSGHAHTLVWIDPLSLELLRKR